MGYCPFLVDLKMVSRQVGPGVSDRAHKPSARRSVCTRQDSLAPRSRHQILRRDMAGARTRVVMGHDMIFMSW